ncbi:13095_t:CDS:2 [Cetraspora pellucida]|uniref:13095_t:CDS:1 n=1 Tax=Cetraspora pellucida TaxID=1433469 RepID=A0A9N9H2Y6_9GLOM|nr:13095_t:CDS:2 [Cetraspora pellucida]
MSLFKRETLKVFNFQIENKSSFTKLFETSKELKDVRKDLAIGKNNLEADELQFINKDGIKITYKCEKIYDLKKICFLNSKHKLAKIYETLIMKNIIKEPFFFRKQVGNIINFDEELNNLKKFLKDDNTLYISTLQYFDIIICIYHS